MIGFSALRAGACGVAFGIFMTLAAAPAQADGTTPPPSTSATRASIDQAIEHERSRRSTAIAGMVVGGAAIVGGSVYSAVASAENHDNRNNGDPERHNIWVGYAVGLGVGLPIMGISAYFFSDAQHQLNLLRRERLSVSYSPDTHQPVLQLSFNY
jgi:hypothetical protein